jgi:hypothetical protein
MILYTFNSIEGIGVKEFLHLYSVIVYGHQNACHEQSSVLLSILPTLSKLSFDSYNYHHNDILLQI